MKPTLCKQQYLYLAFAIAALCFAGAASVQADTNATSTNATSTQNRQMKLEQRREHFAEQLQVRASSTAAKRAELTERVQSRNAKLSDVRQQRISLLAKNATSRLDSAISKIQGFIDRIAAFAATRADNGVDVSAVTALLDEASEVLNEAATLLGDIDIDIAYVVTSDDPQSDWAGLKDQYVEIHDLIKEAHGLVADAITELRSQSEDKTDDTDNEDTTE